MVRRAGYAESVVKRLKAEKAPKGKADKGKAKAKDKAKAKAKGTAAATAATKDDTKVKSKAKPKAPYRPRLKDKFQDEIVKAMMSEFGFANALQVPRVEKIVVNMGVGEAAQESKQLDAAVEELKLITGQKPQIRKAKKSVAAFKIRAGMAIGCRVTLRGDRMYDFLDRLLSIAIPRIRDFRGLALRSFDGTGNYSFGVDEQLIFPEIDYDKVGQTRGMNFTITTTADTDEHAHYLLKSFGLPFREDAKAGSAV